MQKQMNHVNLVSHEILTVFSGIRAFGRRENVLHGIDFLAESGCTTVIIGSTGCGSHSQFEDVVA